MIPELQLIKIKAEAAQLSGVMLVIEPAAVLAMVAELKATQRAMAEAAGFIEYVYCHDPNYSEAKGVLDKLLALEGQ